jgi:hypothetical protein
MNLVQFSLTPLSSRRAEAPTHYFIEVGVPRALV